MQTSKPSPNCKLPLSTRSRHSVARRLDDAECISFCNGLGYAPPFPLCSVSLFLSHCASFSQQLCAGFFVLHPSAASRSWALRSSGTHQVYCLQSLLFLQSSFLRDWRSGLCRYLGAHFLGQFAFPFTSMESYSPVALTLRDGEILLVMKIAFVSV